MGSYRVIEANGRATHTTVVSIEVHVATMFIVDLIETTTKASSWRASRIVYYTHNKTRRVVNLEEAWYFVVKESIAFHFGRELGSLSIRSASCLVSATHSK